MLHGKSREVTMIKSRVVMRLAPLLLFLVLCISAFNIHAWGDTPEDGVLTDDIQLFADGYLTEVPADSLVWSFVSKGSDAYLIRAYAPKAISRTDSYFLVGANALNGRSSCYWTGSWFYARLSLDVSFADVSAPTAEEIAAAVADLTVVMDVTPTDPILPTEPVTPTEPTEPPEDRTDTELLTSIDYRLGVICGIIMLVLVVWFLWTVFGKWFFGSV